VQAERQGCGPDFGVSAAFRAEKLQTLAQLPQRRCETLWRGLRSEVQRARQRAEGGEVVVRITPLGRGHLRDNGRLPAPAE